MTRRWRFITIAVVMSILTVSVVIALAQPPPLPPGHPPINPATAAGLCFECHQNTQLPPPERNSFCGTCHINKHYAFSKKEIPVTRVAPTPAHPLDFNWAASDCMTCHTTPHKTKIAKHPVNASQQNSSFCQPCHQTPSAPEKGVTGKEKVGEFCAVCHTIGLSDSHVKAPDGAKAQFCFQCHK